MLVGTNTYLFKVSDSKGTYQQYGPFNYVVECGNELTISQKADTVLSASATTIDKHPTNTLAYELSEVFESSDDANSPVPNCPVEKYLAKLP